MPEQETVFEESSIVSACSISEIKEKYHLKISPFKQPSGKIAFRITGDVDGAIAEIYSNPKIPLLDYMKELRSVRNAIFTLRSSLNVKGNENDK